jgi:hypothetical protein
MSEREKLKLCMLGSFAVALFIIEIVYLPIWYR